MRKQATVQIDQRNITVNELTVRQMLELYEKGKADNLLATFENAIQMVTDITKDDLLNFAPSEIDIILEKAKEVNASFLAKCPIHNVISAQLKKVISIIQKDLSDQSVG